MSSKPATLAKLTRPRLFGAYRRERLFGLLDGLRERPIVWVVGPPGSGKTTLVASYLEARKAPGIWFQLDSADGDPATFIYYLGLAAEPFATRKTSPLPLLTPEYLGDLEGFARRYFRDLYARMPRGAVIAFDNFHEVRPSAEVRDAFTKALEEIPEGINVVIVSRAPPLAEYSRLAANQRIGRLEWETLRFTVEETRHLAGADYARDEALIQSLHALSGGWAAGLVLMRERLHSALAGQGPDMAESREAVFDYFAGEIFTKAPAERQRLLMVSSFFPRFTATMVEGLTGQAEAARVLDSLYRRHMFTQRRGGMDGTYEYHGLFRDFLRARAHALLGAQEYRQLAERAARMLEADGFSADALELYCEAADWEAAKRVIARVAPSLLAQGRGQTLRQWIEALPSVHREESAWLSYWLGLSLIYTEPDNGRAHLQAAHDRFVAAGDVTGQLLAAAGIIDAQYYEWADFAPLDRWIDFMEKGLATEPKLASTEAELRVYSCFLIALLFRQPEHPLLPDCAERVMRLLGAALDANQKVAAGSILFNYYNWLTKGDSAQRLINLIAPLLKQPEVTPLNQVWWRVHHSFYLYINGDYRASGARMDEAREIALAHGLKNVLFEIYHSEANAAQGAGEIKMAEASMARVESVLNPARRMDVAYFKNLMSGLEMLRGNYRQALLESEQAIRLAEETGMPTTQHPHFIVRAASAHIKLGEYEQALECYSRVVARSSGVDTRNFTRAQVLLRAYQALRDGKEQEAVELLRRSLAGAQQDGYYNFFRSTPEIMSALCSTALGHQVETEFVQLLIKKRGLEPDNRDLEGWPWPLRIYTLGRFSVVREGEPLTFSGKAQKKPLDLLKALVALGGRDVDSGTLIEYLWPDAEGDDGRSSFDSNLYRLRKLLNLDTAIVLQEGKLTLDARCCWVDAWVFERLANRVEASLHRGADRAGIQALGEALLQAYRGHFLDREAAQSWLLPARDRLRAKFQRAVLLIGQHWEEEGRWDLAVAYYQRALEFDNLAEGVYRRLIVCYREQGDLAEALNVYRRCREMLSIVLGVKPSAETEQLHRQLSAG